MTTFAAVYGLHPWDIDRLTVEEFNQYVADSESWVQVRMGVVGEVA